MATNTVYSVVENSETSKRAVEFGVHLDDGSPYTIVVPESGISALFGAIKAYFEITKQKD